MFKSTHVLCFILMALLQGCLPKKQPVIYTEPHCLASQSQCYINLEQARIDILFNVDTVTPEQAFEIIVKSHSPEDNFLIKGHLEGKDMYMGKIPLFFEQNDQGNFVATTMLGSCSEKQMIWRMWLTISDKINPNKSKQVFIDFTSYRR